MNFLHRILEVIREVVRCVMYKIAVALNKVSGGKVSANAITMIGLLAHLPIAWLIAKQYNFLGAVLLIIFGLFDTLDGSVARLQKKAGNQGMLLDASTDRMKEVLLYTGSCSALVSSGYASWAPWAVLACGASLVVSYVKAKGETAVAGGKLTASEVNRLFADGIMRFEIRMFVLVVGLLTNQLRFALVFIAITSILTAIGRLNKIRQKL